MTRCRVEMRTVQHRVLGANKLPDAAWMDTFEHAVGFIGKQRESVQFTALVEMTRERQVPLLRWLAKRPLRALELADVWPKLLDICAWFQAHPRPGVYLREVDVPGMDSKFIERYRGVLGELLECVLPAEAIDFSRSGVSQFAGRFGLCEKPLRIRFRMLDANKSLFRTHSATQDITLDAASFAELDPDVQRVFITENEINFLAFPPHPDSMAVFGAGYGFEMLANTTWLTKRQIHYWGDIDTHGFAILDQLRGRFDHVKSFLMNRETLLAFESQWDREDEQAVHDLARLNEIERALFNELRDNRLRGNLRLEQERISFGWVEAALAAL